MVKWIHTQGGTQPMLGHYDIKKSSKKLSFSGEVQDDSFHERCIERELMMLRLKQAWHKAVKYARQSYSLMMPV